MLKNKMKITKFVTMIMIMVGFVQADFDPQIKFNLCLKLCNLKCVFKYYFNKPVYRQCCHNCEVKCHGMANDATYDCITNCGMTKSINNNIGNHSLSFFFCFIIILHSV
uniref:Uncharacterized protein n=1 Tax=Cajanus cajan TaxID=3821 RepID=A0A151QQ65_CAJCA|nr:hypothetical protein KK1_046881 [Cajanus cajan]